MDLSASAHSMRFVLDPQAGEERFENPSLDRFGCRDIEAVGTREEVKVGQNHVRVPLDQFV
ncbi:MAG TPA: hypothetical protein DEA69_00905 [Microbacterium sp.]|nr:hypothetical protein [Microbacterium sp.]HBS07358.1 hypothetical protein [Microbacterium sp.]